MRFGKGDSSKTKPEQKSYDREWMNWRDQKIIVDEESQQEMQTQEPLDMTEDTKLSVAVPNAPLSERQKFSIMIVLEEKVKFVHVKFRLNPEPKENSWGV